MKLSLAGAPQLALFFFENSGVDLGEIGMSMLGGAKGNSTEADRGSIGGLKGRRGGGWLKVKIVLLAKQQLLNNTSCMSSELAMK